MTRPTASPVTGGWPEYTDPAQARAAAAFREALAWETRFTPEGERHWRYADELRNQAERLETAS
jgi:hypothetical protein